MKTYTLPFLFFLFVVGLFSLTFIDKKVPYYVPKHFPKPVYYFKNNPLSREKYELGRMLFYDPMLSRDSTISCSTCHSQFSGFTHTDHPTSHGIDDKIGRRNSPVIINMAWNYFFNWDGGVDFLNRHSINPLTDKKEMDNSIEEILRRLNENEKYKRLFYVAFDDSIIETPMLMKALASFTVSLVSADSKYDRVKKGEESFTEQEKNGYQLFKQYCASCHKEPLFTNRDFRKNGLTLDPDLKDFGRMEITQNKADSLVFKVPTLRNVEFSFPYMHDGRFKKLSDVLKHYATIHQLPKEKVSKELQNLIPLDDVAQKDLIAFLKTLTDKAFLYNPDFRPPREN